MATYPPRRLLGARPLPSDPCRDPRRSDFTLGGGRRWRAMLAGWTGCFSARRATVRSSALPGSLPRGSAGSGRGAALSGAGSGEREEGGALRPRPSPRATPPPRRPGAGAWGPSAASGAGAGNGEAAWVRPPGDAQRVCVCVFVGHPAPEHLLRSVPGAVTTLPAR